MSQSSGVREDRDALYLQMFQRCRRAGSRLPAATEAAAGMSLESIEIRVSEHAEHHAEAERGRDVEVGRGELIAEQPGAGFERRFA